MKALNKPEDLEDNDVFVFGSNLQGLHGAGAAKTATKVFGAVMGVGEGPTGKCYAIPTRSVLRGGGFKTLSLDDIRYSVERFIEYAIATPASRFIVTPIGCGYAGYSPSDIAPMFYGCPLNVIIPVEFEQHL